jgi:hypothetical protein
MKASERSISTKTNKIIENSNLSPKPKVSSIRNNNSLSVDSIENIIELNNEKNVSLLFSDAMRDFKKMNTPKKLLRFINIINKMAMLAGGRIYKFYYQTMFKQNSNY